ncbi:hypothetical protein Leryth_009352 [Lithospermum erythrorhizon]|nr:hypothetical protein Leryth_009352 [Lithospermum erythrorhizon]
MEEAHPADPWPCHTDGFHLPCLDHLLSILIQFQYCHHLLDMLEPNTNLVLLQSVASQGCFSFVLPGSIVSSLASLGASERLISVCLSFSTVSLCPTSETVSLMSELDTSASDLKLVSHVSSIGATVDAVPRHAFISSLFCASSLFSSLKLSDFRVTIIGASEPIFSLFVISSFVSPLLSVPSRLECRSSDADAMCNSFSASPDEIVLTTGGLVCAIQRGRSTAQIFWPSVSFTPKLFDTGSSVSSPSKLSETPGLSHISTAELGSDEELSNFSLEQARIDLMVYSHYLANRGTNNYKQISSYTNEIDVLSSLNTGTGIMLNSSKPKATHSGDPKFRLLVTLGRRSAEGHDLSAEI